VDGNLFHSIEATDCEAAVPIELGFDLICSSSWPWADDRRNALPGTVETE